MGQEAAFQQESPSRGHDDEWETPRIGQRGAGWEDQEYQPCVRTDDQGGQGREESHDQHKVSIYTSAFTIQKFAG